MTENTSTINPCFEDVVQSVVGNVPYGYEDDVSRVINAVEKHHEELLKEHDYDLHETLIRLADDNGYGTVARDLLDEAGLSARPEPEPVPESVTDEGDLAGTVDILVKQVGLLVQLANRHLGAGL